MSAIEKIVREWANEFDRCDGPDDDGDRAYVCLLHEYADMRKSLDTAIDILIARLKALEFPNRGVY